jgi:biopolymer transport protein ExbB
MILSYRLKGLLLICAMLLTVPVGAQQQVNSLDDLLQAVREDSRQNGVANKEREQRFTAARDRQGAMLDEVKTAVVREERRSVALKDNFDANEQALTELEESLKIRIGNFGELFGVVRQVSGDTKGIIENSLVSAEFPGRDVLLTRLGQSRGLPSIRDLHQLRVLLLEEMTESGKVSRFSTEVIQADGVASPAEVVRVGVFNAVSGDRFLKYEAETGTLQELARQPAGRFQSMAGDLSEAQDGTITMAVDPSRGQLLSLLVQAPGLGERIQQGGLVGYVIIAMGFLGMAIAVWRILVLFFASSRIKEQLKTDTAADDNALGRILSVYAANHDVDTGTLELKLDEAILRETPRLERYQATIKVFAAVAPLLGLLGTVVGMIITFQALTLFGTGDPKLMAGGISQALMTTVLGLVVAIPLVFMHSVVAGWSRSLIEVLEEQSAGIVARHSEAEATST